MLNKESKKNYIRFYKSRGLRTFLDEALLKIFKFVAEPLGKNDVALPANLGMTFDSYLSDTCVCTSGYKRRADSLSANRYRGSTQTAKLKIIAKIYPRRQDNYR